MIVMKNSLDILIALIVHAKKAAQKTIPTFVKKKVDNVLANPISLTEPVILVRINIMIILAVVIADAFHILPTIHLMFVTKKVANAPAMKTMTVESVIVVRMNTMVILVVFSVIAALATP